MRLLDRKTLAVLPAASTDETRYIFNGVLIEETARGVKATATNGRIAAIVERTGGPGVDEFPKVPGLDTAKNGAKSAIIPAAALAEVVKSIPKRQKLPALQNAALIMGETEATLAVTNRNQCKVMPTRLIEGQFPNVDTVIPKGAPVAQICMDAALFAKALQIAGSISGMSYSPVTLSLYGEDKAIKIEAVGPDHRAVVVVMPLKPGDIIRYEDPKEPGTPDGGEPPAPTEPAAGGADDEPFGPVISSYSRAQAIQDGVLVDLTHTGEVKEAGIKYPLAVTRGVYELLEVYGKPGLISAGQSLNGRLWDMLTIMKLEIRRASSAKQPTDRVTFAPLFLEKLDEAAKPVALVAVCGPGDTPEPVITVMFPDED